MAHETKRRTPIILGICIAVVVVVVICILVFVHPWNSGSSSEGVEGTQQSNYSDDASELSIVDLSAYDSEEMKADPAYWVITMFRELPPMVGRGNYLSWNEVEQESDWDFCVTLTDCDESAYFVFSEDYAKETADANMSCTIASFVTATNGWADEDDPPFVQTQDTAVFSLTDKDSSSVSYEDTAALRGLAEAASAYCASWEAAQQQEEAIQDKNNNDNDHYYSFDGLTYYKGRIVVEFCADVSEERMREIVAEVGGEWERSSSWGDAVPEHEGQTSVTVIVPDGQETEAIEALENYDEVSSVWRSGTSKSCDETNSSSTDSFTVGDSATISWDSFLQYYLRYSGFENAWNTSKCNGDVTIGVIDTGIDFENTELSANVDTARMYNAVDDVVGISADMTDQDKKNSDTIGFHGTHVAAVASAIAGDDYGCDGTSFNAVILPVKVTNSEGIFFDDPILDGYKYLINLDDPPDVISLSFARSYSSKSEAEADSYIQNFQDLVNQAWNKGIVTVAASGNDGNNYAEGQIEAHRDENGNLYGYNLYSYPACLDHVVSVGALAEPGWFNWDETTYVPHLTDFSNTNSDVDIVAYGEEIHTVNAYAEWPYWYVSVKGTSFSAPQVASSVALVKAIHPNWSAQQLVDAVISSASDVEEADATNPRGGYGLGALDAKAAVEYTSSSSSGSDEGSGGNSSGGFGGESGSGDSGANGDSSDSSGDDPDRGSGSGSASPDTGGAIVDMYKRYLEE